MNYSCSDIISGFRNKYFEIKEILNKIEQEIKILDIGLNKCKVLLDDDNANLMIYLFDREKHIISAFVEIERKMDFIKLNLENLEFDNSFNSFYHLKNDKYHYHIIIENIKDFYEKISKLLENEFIKEMLKKEIDSDNHIFTLKYDYNSVFQERKIVSNISSINYYPNKDFIKINRRGLLSNSMLKEELNIMYDANNFSEYQRKLIDENKKAIVLFNDNEKGNEFAIQEEEKRLVLIKR